MTSSEKEINLSIRPRGRPIPTLPDHISLLLTDTTSELYKRISSQTGLSIHRLKASKGSDGTLLESSSKTTIENTGLRDKSTIYIKDLGPQISWRTVFLIEYLGPILIHPILYYIYHPPSSSSSSSSASATLQQKLTLIMILIHFLKREFETIFIHRFSGPTMPIMNVFKNSFHYWILGGVNIAYFVYSSSPSFSGVLNSPYVIYSAVLVFVISELANLSTHITLRDLREEGTKKRGIPKGFGFEWVTCPNYLFELVAWIAIVVVSGSWSTALFTIVAGTQMALWARKKEGRYRREFGGGYKAKRWVMVPGVY